MIPDVLWLIIKPILPQKAKRWTRRYNDRKLLNAILWVLYEGGSWRQLPREYGKWNSAYRRYKRWRGDGTWKKIERLLAKYPEYNSPLPPHKFSGIEGKYRKARKAARNSKKKPKYPSKQEKTAKPKTKKHSTGHSNR